KTAQLIQERLKLRICHRLEDMRSPFLNNEFCTAGREATGALRDQAVSNQLVAQVEVQRNVKAVADELSNVRILADLFNIFSGDGDRTNAAFVSRIQGLDQFMADNMDKARMTVCFDKDPVHEHGTFEL